MGIIGVSTEGILCKGFSISYRSEFLDFSSLQERKESCDRPSSKFSATNFFSDFVTSSFKLSLASLSPSSLWLEKKPSEKFSRRIDNVFFNLRDLVLYSFISLVSGSGLIEIYLVRSLKSNRCFSGSKWFKAFQKQRHDLTISMMLISLFSFSLANYMAFSLRVYLQHRQRYGKQFLTHSKKFGQLFIWMQSDLLQ